MTRSTIQMANAKRKKTKIIDMETRLVKQKTEKQKQEEISTQY